MTTSGGSPAGWYDDGTGQLRYYDGTGWTDQVHPPEPEPTPAEPSTAVVPRAPAEAAASTSSSSAVVSAAGQVPATGPRPRMTSMGSVWYVLQCIAFGAGYFAKIPAKRALSDAGLAKMTTAENFWYVLQCIAFGAGYFAKIPTAKALSEVTALPDPRAIT